MMPFYAPFGPFNPYSHRRVNNYYPPYNYSHNGNLNSNFKNGKPCFPSVSPKKEQDNFSCSKNDDVFLKNSNSFSKNDNSFFKNTDSFSKNDNSFSNNTNNSENVEDFNPGFFEILGLKLGFDDLLIIAMLFFLYKEEVNDSSLYLVLILLLLT